jgi:hypothetical protein
MSPDARRLNFLRGALLALGAATLVHHIHNAVFLAEYPNMPASLTAPKVILAWAGATAIGIAGYRLVRRRHRVAGCALLALYGAYGLDGLLHYVLAPLSAHSAGMNATIWLEAVSGALMLAVTLRLFLGRAA